MDIFSRDVPPTHPGVILAEALENMNLKIMPAASLLGTSRQKLCPVGPQGARLQPVVPVGRQRRLAVRQEPLH